MKNINVYLTVNMRDHPLYRELIKYPPTDVKYYQLGSASFFSEAFCNKFRGGLNILTKLRYGLYPTNKCDLIHSSQTLILNRKPWVVDFEHVSAFVKFKQKRLEKCSIRRSLEKALSSKYCKKIMPHSEAGKKSLINAIDCKKFEDKIEVIYPAISTPILRKKKTNTKVRLLHVGRKFFMKGGVETLLAFKQLNERYDIQLEMISNVPTNIIDKYREYDNIIFTPATLSHSEILKNHFSQADIFIYPSPYDTFGIVLVEALAYGLPIVTLKGFAREEIVVNGGNGFIINSYPICWYDEKYAKRYEWDQFKTQLKKKERERIVKDIVEKLSLLIEDEKLRRKMGRFGRKQIENGKFSNSERNKKLKRIYEESLRK